MPEIPPRWQDNPKGFALILWLEHNGEAIPSIETFHKQVVFLFNQIPVTKWFHYEVEMAGGIRWRAVSLDGLPDRTERNWYFFKGFLEDHDYEWIQIKDDPKAEEAVIFRLKKGLPEDWVG